MPDTLRLSFRPMTEADLDVALYIKREAMDALGESQGIPREPWRPETPVTLRHLLRTDAEGAWLAQIDGVPVGYSMALVRGKIWFLSQLFVQPDQHAHGIGAELLRRARQYGRDRGATVFSVIASTSEVAHALYMRAGMFATGIAYHMSGPLEPLLRLPEPAANRKRIVDCSGWQDRIAELDREVFGAERRQDHAFYLSPEPTLGEGASFGLTQDGAFLGYAYAFADGRILPLAAREPTDQLPLLRMAAGWLLDQEVSTARMFVISHNTTLMTALLASGWRSQHWSFLLASERFAKFDRYHPAGGMLL